MCISALFNAICDNSLNFLFVSPFWNSMLIQFASEFISIQAADENFKKFKQTTENWEYKRAAAAARRI